MSPIEIVETVGKLEEWSAYETAACEISKGPLVEAGKVVKIVKVRKGSVDAGEGAKGLK